MAMITIDECDRKRSKLLDKGRVGSRCREGGSTARGEKFQFAPPPTGREFRRRRKNWHRLYTSNGPP